MKKNTLVLLALFACLSGAKASPLLRAAREHAKLSPVSGSPGTKCVDFSGHWKGTCSDVNSKFTIPMEIVLGQNACDSIRWLEMDSTHDGGDMTFVFPFREASATQIKDTTLYNQAQWNQDQSKASLMNVELDDTLSSDGSHHYFLVGDVFDLSKVGSRLLISDYDMQLHQLYFQCVLEPAP